MHTHANKGRESGVRAVANRFAAGKHEGNSTALLADNRPEARHLRQLQLMADNSPQAANAARLQSMADSGPCSVAQSLVEKTQAQSHPVQETPPGSRLRRRRNAR